MDAKPGGTAEVIMSFCPSEDWGKSSLFFCPGVKKYHGGIYYGRFKKDLIQRHAGNR